MINALLQVVVLIGAYVVTRQFPPISDLYLVPLAVVVLVLFSTALGLILGAVNVYLRDVQYVTDVVMMLAMWGSPIVYAWTMARDAFATLGLPSWAIEVYTNNPITLGVLGFRQAFWGAGEPGDYPDDLLLRMLVAGLVGLVLLFVSHRVFTRLQGNFAQEM